MSQDHFCIQLHYSDLKDVVQRMGPKGQPAKRVNFKDAVVPEASAAVVTTTSTVKPRVAKQQRQKPATAGTKSAPVAKPVAKQTGGKKPGGKTGVVAHDAPAVTTGGEPVKRSKNVPPYYVLRLDKLPRQFQETELRQFFSQFGNVISTLVLRNKRTSSSKGTALVHFKDEAVLPAVVEECQGMLLGNHVITATRQRMTRPFPAQEKISARQRKDWLRRTRGPVLKRHKNFSVLPLNSSFEDATDDQRLERDILVLDRLRRYASTENKHNKYLKDLGVKYVFNGFSDQLVELQRRQSSVVSSKANNSLPKAAPSPKTKVASKTSEKAATTPLSKKSPGKK